MLTNFIGTELKLSELTEWILKIFSKFKITEIRYFGSRINGAPRENSDIDTYIVFKGKTPEKGPLFTELYKHNGKNYQIEFHAFVDFADGYIPTYLIGNAENQITQQSKNA